MVFTPPSDPPASSSLAPRASEGLPCRFGEYTLLRRRASGGMAELFVATRGSEAGTVVVKRVLPSLGADADREALARLLLSEGRTIGALSYPGVPRLLDAGCVGDVPFIVLEHIHGEDLRSIVRQMRKRRVTEFPIEHALSIVRGVCEALAHVHERCDASGSPLGIVHRDVSPQNVLATFAGEVKLVDFGVATGLSPLGASSTTGRPKGKLPYMSPEQARGESVDGRSDVFAAGILLFELTTGHRLFKGASEQETLERLVDRAYPRPSELVYGYAPALEAIVCAALAKDRAERWSSARAMGAALDAFVRQEGVDATATALGRLVSSLFEEEIAEESAALASARVAAQALP